MAQRLYLLSHPLTRPPPPSPGVLALQGSPRPRESGFPVGHFSGSTGEAAHTGPSRLSPGRRVNPMTSCLGLFPRDSCNRDVRGECCLAHGQRWQCV